MSSCYRLLALFAGWVASTLGISFTGLAPFNVPEVFRVPPLILRFALRIPRLARLLRLRYRALAFRRRPSCASIAVRLCARLPRARVRLRL